MKHEKAACEPDDFRLEKLSLLAEIMGTPEMQMVIAEALREMMDQQGRLVILEGEQRLH